MTGFFVDAETYTETQTMILDWLRHDCGAVGATVARAYRHSDDGAREIVDALVINIVGHTPGGITVTERNDKGRARVAPTVDRR